MCRLLGICGPVRELTKEDVAAPHQRDPLDAEHQTEDGPVKIKEFKYFKTYQMEDKSGVIVCK